MGGHCSERKKWYSYFDNVQAVLFMVALSGYDQTLDENHSRVSITYLIFRDLVLYYRISLTLECCLICSKTQMI